MGCQASKPVGHDEIIVCLETRHSSRAHTSVPEVKRHVRNDSDVDPCIVTPGFLDVSVQGEQAELKSTLSLGPLVILRARLRMITELCDCVRVFEAHSALLALEHDSKALNMRLTAEGSGHQTRALEFLRNLHCDRMCNKLRVMGPRMKAKMKDLGDFVPQDMGKGDDRWGNYYHKFDAWGPDCNVKLIARFLEEHERDESLGATQFVVVWKASNLPFTFTQCCMAFNNQDLLKPEWLSMRAHVAKRGGLEQLHSQMVIQHRASPVPFMPDIESAVFQEMSICTEPPCPGFEPGVMSMGTPFSRMSASEGWGPLPPTRRGASRCTPDDMCYLTPGEHPNTCTIQAVIRMDAPVPRSLLPLKFGTRFGGQLVVDGMQAMKEGCFDNWPRTGLLERMCEHEGFVQSLQALNNPK